MKLLASAIATAALILSGLVAVPTTANAAPVYPGSVNTICSINVPNTRVGRKAKARVSVRTAGRAHPAGVARIFVFNKRGKVVRTRAISYRGPRARKVNLGKFRKGRYTAVLNFNADSNTVYRDCSDSDRFRVKKKKRR